MRDSPDSAPDSAPESTPGRPGAGDGGTAPGSAPGAVKLAVRRLSLTAFRNYPALRLETGPEPVVLCGPNGAGKTNLIEAVSLLTPGRGLRRARIEALQCRRDPRPWAVAGRVARDGLSVDLGTGLDPARTASGRPRRVVRIDGRPARSQTALAAHMSAVWLTPEMDRILPEGAGPRRRFLDRLVFTLDPAHARRLSAFDKALRERARLLREGRGSTAWLAGLEAQMAEGAVAIAAARRDLVARLGRVAAAPLSAFPAAHLDLSGHGEDRLSQGPALAAEESLRVALADSRPRDARAGGAAIGPHRSDLRLIHGETGQPIELCSTGETKALLVRLILAQARLLAAETGCLPVLLLDEITAHLDPARRDALFAELDLLGAQAWLTGSEPGLFAGIFEHAQFFHLAGGEIRPERRA